MLIRVALLDDYQNVARTYADWGRLDGRAEVTVFADHVADEDALVARLEPFAAVAIMRERTPFPRRVLERLPNLKLIATSGMWNASVDLAACEELGIIVSGTQAGGGATAQVTWALILALRNRSPSSTATCATGAGKPESAMNWAARRWA